MYRPTGNVLIKPRTRYPTGTKQEEPVVSLLDQHSQLALHMRSRSRVRFPPACIFFFFENRLHLFASFGTTKTAATCSSERSFFVRSVRFAPSSQACRARATRCACDLYIYNCNSYVLYVRASIHDRSVCRLFPCCIVVFCWDTCIVRTYHGPYVFLQYST
jgi:hypothetical protein